MVAHETVYALFRYIDWASTPKILSGNGQIKNVNFAGRLAG